jgi:hypothetical protein
MGQLVAELRSGVALRVFFRFQVDQGVNIIEVMLLSMNDDSDSESADRNVSRFSDFQQRKALHEVMTVIENTESSGDTGGYTPLSQDEGEAELKALERLGPLGDEE